ncbi:MAG: FlgD immunoglobulin-like domain containing protein, partial [Gemmatimonadota bacterium]|nr:FlgD immunoglobulin-like domain containing protein [Gemmatimonadota bacterium]
LERVCQRMLHEHRCYLDIVPYSQSPQGTAGYRHAPDLTGQGANLTVSDWTEYDKRFDPLFSGTAFEGNPRSGAPIPFYYLPFHTTWPVPNTGTTIAEWVFEDADYIAGYTKIVTEFEAHINEMGWDRTSFVCYNNEKERYGNSWDLDEPTTQEHYAALNFYAGMFHNGLKGEGAAKMVYRCDMGHYSYLRGELDDAVNLWVLNRGDYPETKLRERQAAGAIAWTYGSAPCIYDNMVDNHVSYYTNWGRGARGFVYWLTFGAWSSTDNAWTRNHKGDTNLFYPGHGGATNMVGNVACPSLRMKVVRDITEVMEALYLMGNSSSYTVEQSEALARQYNTGKIEDYAKAEETIKRTIDGISGSAPEPPPPGSEVVCDFNEDGSINITDVIALLRFQRANPGDLGGDFNGDGSANITDAISMLLAQRDPANLCPDASASLAASPVKNAHLRVSKLENLTEADIQYIEKAMSRMRLTAEEEAAFRLALDGRGAAASLPKAFSLAQNTPNPFNPSTSIGFTVAGGASVKVTLKIFTLRGQLVRTLVADAYDSGTYNVFWDGTDNTGNSVSSGVYFYRMKAGDFIRTRKMVLLK